jgi:hypothetical protein
MSSFRVSLCVTKSGTRLRNLFFIIVGAAVSDATTFRRSALHSLDCRSGRRQPHLQADRFLLLLAQSSTGEPRPGRGRRRFFQGTRRNALVFFAFIGTGRRGAGDRWRPRRGLRRDPWLRHERRRQGYRPLTVRTLNRLSRHFGRILNVSSAMFTFRLQIYSVAWCAVMPNEIRMELP